jgi:hypothetical protein
MAHEQLGKHDEAPQWLCTATREVDDLRELPRSNSNLSCFFGNEFDRRDYEILRVEAEALILYDPIFPANPFARGR